MRLLVGQLILLLVLVFSIVACAAPPAPVATTAPSSSQPTAVKPTEAPQPTAAAKATEAPKATGAAPAAGGGTLTYAQSIVVTKIDAQDPLQYPTGYEAVFLIFDNLVRLGPDMTPKPDLAQSWETSTDGLTWTFHLRSGVKFHDGTPFNAAAVKFNIERIQDTKLGFTNRVLWTHITSVEAKDDNTVVLTTKQPFAPMLFYLAHGSGGIVSPDAVKKLGDKDFALKPVGTGPYKVDSFQPGVSLTLVRNDDYWGGKPGLAKVVMNYAADAQARVAQLQSGQADLIDSVPVEQIATLKSDPNIVVLQQPAVRAFFLTFNLKRPIFQDVRVRQAFNYAVDKDTIVKTLFFGFATPMDSPMASGMAGYKSILKYNYDVAKAKQLLDDAGWKVNASTNIREKDGVPLKANFYTAEGEYPKDLQVAEAVQAYLKAVGADIQIVKVEAAAIRTFRKVPAAESKYDIMMFGFNASNGDPSYHLQSNWLSNADETVAPAVWNMMWYKNPDVDKAIQDSLVIVDPAKRQEALTKAQTLIMQDAPNLFLYTPQIINATRKGVSGVDVLPTLFIDLRKATKQ